MSDALVKRVSEWVWNRCPGCGRTSKYAGDPRYPNGDFHSDGCPLEGIYGHQHKWWFERELERLETERDSALSQAAKLRSAVEDWLRLYESRSASQASLVDQAVWGLRAALAGEGEA